MTNRFSEMQDRLAIVSLIVSIVAGGLVVLFMYFPPTGRSAYTLVFASCTALIIGVLGAIIFGRPSKRIADWLFSREK